jgi:hypothetical protein
MDYNMKHSTQISLCFTLVLSLFLTPGCNKEKDNKFYAGYINPGPFRPRGVAWEKCYNFTNVPISCDSQGGAANSGRCGAVHTVWLAGASLDESVPTEGMAANDMHQIPTTFTIKIMLDINLSWKITLVRRGVSYTGNTRKLEMVKYNSSVRTTPAYDPTPLDPNSGDELAESTTFLPLVFVKFGENVTLWSNPSDHTKPSLVIVQTGALPGPDPRPVYEDPPGTPVYNLPISGDYMVTQSNI